MRIRNLIPIVAVMLVAGCAKPPAQQIDQAKVSMESARTARAADYAPAAWVEATGLESQLADELKIQEEKPSFFRSYAKTSQLAESLKGAADKATQEAAAGMETAKRDAEALMIKAREARDRADKALASAPRGKGTEADLASLRSDNSATDATLDEMQKAFDAGDYLAAKAKAEAVIQACDGVLHEIEAARSRRRSG